MCFFCEKEYRVIFQMKMNGMKGCLILFQYPGVISYGEFNLKANDRREISIPRKLAADFQRVSPLNSPRVLNIPRGS